MEHPDSIVRGFEKDFEADMALRYEQSLEPDEQLAEDVIELEVHCRGCGKRIDKPSECNMDLFSIGFPLHTRNSCLLLAEQAISAYRHTHEER